MHACMHDGKIILARVDAGLSRHSSAWLELHCAQQEYKNSPHSAAKGTALPLSHTGHIQTQSEGKRSAAADGGGAGDGKCRQQRRSLPSSASGASEVGGANAKHIARCSAAARCETKEGSAERAACAGAAPAEEAGGAPRVRRGRAAQGPRDAVSARAGSVYRGAGDPACVCELCRRTVPQLHSDVRVLHSV
jgi:hypothetical protein